MSTNQNCWHILVVDDDPLFVKLVEFHLRDYECTIGTVENCDDAVRYLQQNDVHCILMDQRLSAQRTGTECVKQVREAAYLGSVIILTGWPDQRNIVAALRAGADDYLDKDKMMGHLYRSIKGAIEVRAESAGLRVKRHSTEIGESRRLLKEAQDIADKLNQDSDARDG